ncbi:hypothetical protein BJ322DRAFT_1172484 [Thelephora terrestris]|uniref:G-patch domain-containing protein n=1 Tax=Thelephora terrestris TaxID=56493 RepID=A0A9P6H4I6_9AGAM|nr:hypothetical protein BJ322DRAFT_1172484 [Thelephora terrestris]
MTSRLKRKLNDLGVDTSGSKANESFCLIGTPLPPLEKSRDTGEFVPLWKQEVRDEKGRRRLHGAFTGGFSAGYFNTVGSKEGWTPSTFKSSRTDRAKQKALRPEDFMDEEDKAELRDSQTLVPQNEEVDIAGKYAGDLASRSLEGDDEQDSVSLALEKALLPTPKESPAAKLLTKMGWRPGQGIGPRLTWKQKKLRDAQAKSTRILALDDLKLDPDEEDEEAQKHTYPRPDTPLNVVARKDDAHGLGYNTGPSLNVALGNDRNSKPSGPRISAGFGLGALNDADEDDIDIYDSGPSSRRGLTAYEAGDENRYHHSIQKSASKSQMGASIARNAPLQRFKNGDPVLQEFVLADTPVTEDKWYRLEDVPSGWKPDPHRVWDKYSKENEPAAPVPIPGNKGNLTIEQVRSLPTMNFTAQKSLPFPAAQRGQALGETSLPTKPRSVFDYLSQKDRERLKNFIPPQVRSEEPALATPLPPPPEISPPSGEFVYPRLDPSVAKAALLGFKPFTSDPVKQARYTAYLKSQSEVVSDEDRLQLKQTPGQDLEHFQNELREYAQAATVFKPLSGAMAGRFTTAKAVDHGPAVIEGLHTPSQAAPSPEAEPPETKVEEPENAKTHAVKHGMYGILTRETSVWVPVKLLCKRFGVKEPEIEAREEDPNLGSKAQADWEQETAFPEAELVASGAEGGPSAAAVSQGAGGDERPKRRDLANVGLGEDETQGADVLTYQRPERSIFKAIFASDEEDSDDEDEAKVEDTDLREASVPAPSGAPAPPSKKDVQMDVDEGPIDLATFKPKFVPRTERAPEDNPPTKKRKKDKERRKSGKALVSFDAEEGEDSPVVLKSKDKDRERERKKKRRPKGKDSGKDEKRQGEADDDGDDMWVEKAVPEVVQKMSVDTPSELPKGKTEEAGRLGKRMRAEDFM